MQTKVSSFLTVTMLLALIISATGCQTFTMTQADFKKQQAGKPVDRDVGTAVGAVGSAAYFGYAIGSLLAGGLKK